MGDLTCKDCFVYVKVLQYIYQKDNQGGYIKNCWFQDICDIPLLPVLKIPMCAI